MSYTPIKFGFTTDSNEFKMVCDLETSLWALSNDHGVICKLDDKSYLQCASLMKFVNDGSITAKKIANKILSCEWELA